jgi:cation transport regulator ChaC
LLLVLAASVVLGSTCLLINLGIFLLVGFVPIMESAKQNADEQILTLGVILYKWRSENALECDEFVARAHSLRKLYDAVLRATGQPRKEELVFAYGSNMDLEQMRERCPGSDLRPFVAEARGWRLCFPRRANKRRGGVGSVIRHLGESVWGVVFRVTPEDLRTLDKREGVFIDAYHRERIEVFSVDGKSYDVWTYFAVPQDSPARDYTPHRDYISLYLRGAEQFKLPPEYQEKLRKIETSNT